MPWHDWLTPWRTDITTATVDEVRTAALSRPDLDTPIDLGVPNGVYQGATRDAAADPRHRRPRPARSGPWSPPVIRTETRRFLFWTWRVPVAIEHPIGRSRCRRRPPRGDPQGAWDQHAYLWRPDAGRLVEMIQLEHTPMFGAEWTVGWDGGGPGIAVWDTTKAWDAAGQPRGVVAAHIPQMPHFIRFDEVAAGREPRRLLRAAPLRARPHRLRPGLGRQGLHRAAPGRGTPPPHRRCTPTCRRSSRRVVDGSDGRHRAAHPRRCPRRHRLDAQLHRHTGPRWKQFGWRGLGLRLSDFEIITQP